MKPQMFIYGIEAIGIAIAGAIANSAIVSAVIGGLFLIANTILTLALTRLTNISRDRRRWQKGNDRRAGQDRRRENRVITSRGPFIRRLEIISALTAILAVGSLVFALALFSDQLTFVQDSRQRSATDTCYILRKLILRAGTEQHHSKRAEEFLDALGLGNCIYYGQVTRTSR